MKGFARFVALAPFWGRTKIRPALFESYRSTKAERFQSWVRIMVFLVIIISLHSSFAVMGIRGLRFNAPFIVKVVFGLYVVANVAVSIVQGYYMYRATRFFCKGKYRRGQEQPKEFTVQEEMTMIMCTLPAQILVVVLFLIYMPAGC